MSETRDLDIKWPQWHTLLFEGQVAVDMRVVCPRDVKKMLVKQVTRVNWKKSTAEHVYEELKEGVRLEPALALLRKKVREDWTEKHRNVARKIFQDVKKTLRYWRVGYLSM